MVLQSCIQHTGNNFSSPCSLTTSSARIHHRCLGFSKLMCIKADDAKLRKHIQNESDKEGLQTAFLPDRVSHSVGYATVNVSVCLCVCLGRDVL